MKKQIATLYRLFHALNRELFENKIPRPTITIQRKGKHNAFGWVTIDKIWASSKSGVSPSHELNFCAEYMARPYDDICSTMIHEMVHLDNLEKGIKDVSRGGSYHNKRFLKRAKEVGLDIQHHPTHGWTITELSPSLRDKVRKLDVDPRVFHLARIDEEPPQDPEPKQTMHYAKLICPKCGLYVKANRDNARLLCLDCDEEMEEKII